jgi:hypothetical protein
MIRQVRCSDDQGPFCFLSYFPEKMRAMVPTIYANTVNPIQNNAMIRAPDIERSAGVVVAG